MNSWCKLATGFYADPAILRAGEAAELLFVRGLAYAAEHAPTTGRIPRAALPLLAPKGHAARASALVRENLWLADGDDYVIRSWGHWQQGLDALGKRRTDDRKRQAIHRRHVAGDHADCSDRCPGYVTMPRDVSRDESRDVTAPEIEVDTEVEDVLRTSKSGAHKPRPDTGSRIPEPFVISDDMRRWAHAEGWNDAGIDRVTESFVDYWRGKPGTAGRKVDWPSTWRNWIRREATTTATQRRPTTDDRVAAGLQLAQRLATEGR